MKNIELITKVIKENGEVDCDVNGEEFQDDKNGTRAFFKEGRLHRVKGPAIIKADGTKEWYFEGRLHRLGGPAIEYSDGTCYWFVHGECIAWPT